MVFCNGNSSKGIQGRVVAKFFSNSSYWGSSHEFASVGAPAVPIDEFTEPPSPEWHAFSGKSISLSMEMESVIEVYMLNQSCIPEIEQQFQDP